MVNGELEIMHNKLYVTFGFTVTYLAVIDIINLFLYFMVALKLMSFMRFVPLLAQLQVMIG